MLEIQVDLSLLAFEYNLRFYSNATNVVISGQTT